MKSILLYYPFQIAKEANSGSKVRPKEIHKAFLAWGQENGIEVLLLSGSSKEREETFFQWQREGKLDNLWFCYMENQTIPFWLTDQGHIPKKPLIDQKVMRFLKAKKVPVGVFYRDVYWKFDELYPLKGIKKFIMKSIYRLEEKFYEKYCDVIFLPSEAMGRYVQIEKPMVPLPPGGKGMKGQHSKSNIGSKKGLYVGGINNEDYGLFLLLDALSLANKDQKNCELTIVCRPDEFEKLPSEKKSRLLDAGVTVKHVSGEALNTLYKEMDYAFIPRFKSVYNDFSVPVKLVEYLSNELPVIATHCEAQKDIIEADEYGLICEDNPESMAQAILRMNDEVDTYRSHIQKSFVEKHSWLARVKKVKSVLIKEESR